MSTETTAIALVVIAEITIGVGTCAALFGIMTDNRQASKHGYAIAGAGQLAQAAGQWLEHKWLGLGASALLVAWLWWLWWRSGGDDDWRKRRRKLGSWARSHIPRPTIVAIRTTPSGAGT